jgi:hypothetical protein
MFNHFNMLWMLLIIPLLISEQNHFLMILDYLCWLLLVLMLDNVSVMVMLIIPRIARLLILIFFLLVLLGHISLSRMDWSFFSGISEGGYSTQVLLIFVVFISDIAVVRAYIYRFYNPDLGYVQRTPSRVNKLSEHVGFPARMTLSGWHPATKKQKICTDKAIVSSEGSLGGIKSLRMYNPFMSLIYKSVVRNARPRTMLFSTWLLLILLCGLIVKTGDNQSFMTYYLFTCLNGVAAFSIGYHLFSIDTGIYPLFHTSVTNIESYISAKYWFLTLATLIIASIFIPLLAEDIHDTIRFLSNASLVLGVCNPLVLLLGIQFSQKMDLFRNSFANAQGSNFYQMVLLVIISLLPVAILVAVSQIVSPPYVDYLILAAGLVIVSLYRKVIGGCLIMIFKGVKYDKIQNFS